MMQNGGLLHHSDVIQNGGHLHHSNNVKHNGNHPHHGDDVTQNGGGFQPYDTQGTVSTDQSATSLLSQLVMADESYGSITLEEDDSAI